MNRYLVLYAVLMTATAIYGVRHLRSENRRLSQNQTALLAEVTHFRNAAGEAVTSVQALRLRCAEFEELRAADAAAIRNMGIKLRRVTAHAKSVSATSLTLHTPLRDTILIYNRDTLIVRDTVQVFRWRDTWVSVDGFIDRDSVRCNIRSIDTLRQVVHRIPRRFLFFRWGTKALQQQITSSNPHTAIIHTEYIHIEP